MFISIIVCTRNRSDKLPATLRSLAQLHVQEDLRWEILVIDNGSTDDTSEVCKAAITEYGSNYRLRYIYEGSTGKCNALNRGIREAKGDIFAFTDDDCIVDRTWLQEIRKEYEADPELAVLGGRVELYNKQDLPKSIVTMTERIVVSDAPDMVFRPAIIGANISFKREVSDAVGDYDVRLGPGSRAQAIAEDLDYLYMAWKKGFRIVYSPSVLVLHDHGRQSEDELESLSYRYQKGRGSFYSKHAFHDAVVLGRLYRDLKWNVKNIVINLFAGKSTRGERRALQAMFLGAISRLSN